MIINSLIFFILWGFVPLWQNYTNGAAPIFL